MDQIILLNKAEGLSSFKAIEQAKRQLNLKKIGHAGTLDPFATGLLIACTNRATKLISLFQEMPKFYEATFCFGTQTDTDDVTGEVIKETDHIPSLEEIKDAIPSFTGEIEQMPPQYSALRVNGKRAYQLARKGKEVDLKARKRWVYRFEILEANLPEIKVLIQCSSGTYIRSLARDLGLKLNSLGYVKKLHRSQIGSFKSENAKNPEEIKTSDAIPIEKALNFLPYCNLKKNAYKKVLNGVPFQLDFCLQLPELKENFPYFAVKDHDNQILAILNKNKYMYISL